MVDASTAPWWTYVISGAIGAAGAVGAQITAGIFSGKREKEKLDFEKARHKREVRDRTRDLFYDSKRVVFIRALGQAEALKTLFEQAILELNRYSGSGKLPDDLEGKIYAWEEDWYGAKVEIGFFDESLLPLMNRVQEDATVLYIGLKDEGMAAASNDSSLPKTIDQLRRALRRSLEGGED